MLESLAAEFGRSRVNEVRESSGRLPPNAKYWLPRDGIVAVSALMFLFVCVCVCVCVCVNHNPLKMKIQLQHYCSPIENVIKTH